jgi:hypothetical protein
MAVSTLKAVIFDLDGAQVDTAQCHLAPGTLELLAGLKAAGVKIVLSTAAQHSRLQILDQFDAITDRFSDIYGKPQSDILRSATQLVDATPVECIVVAYTAEGINAALDGGFVAVGVGTGVSLGHAHLSVASLHELDTAKLCALHAHYRADLWTITRDGVHPGRESSLEPLLSRSSASATGASGCVATWLSCRSKLRRAPMLPGFSTSLSVHRRIPNTGPLSWPTGVRRNWRTAHRLKRASSTARTSWRWNG